MRGASGCQTLARSAGVIAGVCTTAADYCCGYARQPMTDRLIRFNKPYGVLSQFTAEGKWQGLKDYIDLPGVYVAGRHW
jgi:16S rRNA U516 pseudouridylate synthase RsuA-like enzyme